MSKVKEVKKEDPFGVFNILKGGFVPPDEDDSEIKSGDDTIVQEELLDIESNKLTKEEEENLIAGNKVIEENIKKAAELKALKNKEENSDKDDPEFEDTNKEESSVFKEIVNQWYNKAIIDFDSSDPEFVESEEGVHKLVSKTILNRIDKWADSLPEDFNELLNYVQKGGNPKVFLDIYYGKHSWEDFQLESDEAKKAVIRENLLLKDETPEDIDDIIKMYEHNGSIDKMATSALSKLQKYEKEQKEDLLKSQAELAEKQKEKSKSEFEEFKKEFYSKENLLGFKLDNKTKDNLFKFLTVPDKRTGLTQYEKTIKENKDSQLLFALQAMQGFNIKSLEKQAQTKVSNNYSEIFKNYKDGDTKMKISSGKTPEHIDENPFEGFKKIKA